MHLTPAQWDRVLSSNSSNLQRRRESLQTPDVPTTTTTPIEEFDTNLLRNVSYVLALEGSKHHGKDKTFFERLLDDVVQTVQPSPSIVHVELLFPPTLAGDEMHFSTYIGNVASWGSSMDGKREFYLGENASMWRAVPVVCKNAAHRLRSECKRHVGTPYSLSKYICALPPFRFFAGVFSESAQSSAHCAILTARCLKSGLLRDFDLEHPSHWFGPSTLFLEVDSLSNRETFSDRFSKSRAEVRALVEEEEEARALETLLRGSDDSIRTLSFESCMMAIDRLTSRALMAEKDDVSKQISQKQLATALLRFSIVRESGGH